MAGLVQITFEGRQSVSDIQKKFKEHMSEKEILKTTARAINEVANKVQGNIRQQIRKEYTVKNKWLMKTSYVSKMAAGDPQRLYAHVSFSYRPIPMIAFKHTGGTSSNIKTKQTKPISVTIKKGQTKEFRHASIKIKKNGDIGIFSQGRYVDKKFTFQKDNKRITELKTASPFTMAFSKSIQPVINNYVTRELPAKLQLFLDRKLKKMAK